jgi:hypothetical protein
MIEIVLAIIVFCVIGIAAIWITLIRNASKWDQECEDRLRENCNKK